MKRRTARIVAVQCLYQMEMTGAPPEAALRAVLAEALGENETGIEVGDADALEAYVGDLLARLVPRLSDIDRVLSEFLHGYRLERLSRVDRAVLRLATFELLYADEEDVPPKAAVNEAIEVAKQFGTEESGRFVNGVLGKIIRRRDELRAARKA